MWREKEREDSLCRAAGFGPSFVFSALVTGHARIHSSTSPLWIQSFDHVADRGHLRRALEKVNYAGGTRPLSISKEMVERNDCEFQITDSPRYPSVLSSFRRPIRRLWKIEISKGKGREAILEEKIEKQLLRRRKDNVWRNTEEYWRTLIN